MKFDDFDLVPWLNDAKGVMFDLANSAAMPPSLKSLGIDLEGVPLGYANIGGFPELRTTVAEVYDIEEKEVALTSGTQEASFLALASLTKPGGKVAVEVPSYPPVYTLPKALGCNVVPLKRLYTNDFAVQIGDVEGALKKGAKVICLTNPHNPSGKAIGAKNLAEICQLAESFKVYVIVDEIYKELMPKQPPLARHISESAMTVSGIAKAYGMGGVRVGWGIGPSWLTKKMHLAKDYVSVSNSTHGETIAIAALKQRAKILPKAQKYVQENLVTVDEFMSSQRSLAWVKPDGVNICFPKLPKGVKSIDFCKKALKIGVLLAPGKYFGQEGHVRLTFGCPKAELKGGLKELKNLLEEYR